MVAIRMPLAGCILYLVFRPKLPHGKLQYFLVFSVLGLWAAQFTYLLAIDFSNAATGTLLQFLFLPMVAAYEIVITRTRPSPSRMVAVLLAIAGTIELVAGSSEGALRLLVTPAAAAIGVTSACAVVVFTLVSRPLVKQYGSPTVTTWGLLLGSLVAIPTGSYSVFSYALESLTSEWPQVLALIFFIAIVGTACPFFLYFKGLESATATEVGIVAAAEPITAAVASFILLHVVLTGFQYLGGALIVAAVATAAVSTTRSTAPMH